MLHLPACSEAELDARDACESLAVRPLSVWTGNFTDAVDAVTDAEDAPSAVRTTNGEESKIGVRELIWYLYFYRRSLVSRIERRGPIRSSGCLYTSNSYTIW